MSVHNHITVCAKLPKPNCGSQTSRSSTNYRDVNVQDCLIFPVHAVEWLRHIHAAKADCSVGHSRQKA